MTRVTVGGRIHVGFQNLSLAHERLYGGVGLALAEPRLDLRAERAEAVDCDDDAARPYVERVVDHLDVPGATVRVDERLPRHAGLGSGTQLALAALVAVAGAYDIDVDPRERAPALGRGGRSGIGVATFESGGFVVDGGHPTERFTTAPPAEGEWAVPPVVARHDLPDDWRFVLAIPDAGPGRSGDEEDESMRSVVERADPGIAEDIALVVTQGLLPAAATGDRVAFGDAVARLGRLNGAWYADEQGGVYRPPAGAIIDALSAHPAVAGAGQSSWGPTVYALTDADYASEVADAARAALSDAADGGRVVVARPRDEGATVADD
ncbi:beta-ribofuranosylaminobenzene 5'-phosphate synthase family protein [Halosimplex pelagicum]|uniref:Beta-ribofuranosylaminobenzene 5'-phosphate synthase n=1 Tax=Halosimplex pelagicum TaxID=869886 RepID=A0A7D5PCA2_9EURY|nr:beta-ribofuranosylaminobenzene 5'-phosphate synthase family protein [Halosimplex pelagicum]QLH84484.1 GHMP kinase [Halosimplex pelagicum]